MGVQVDHAPMVVDEAHDPLVIGRDQAPEGAGVDDARAAVL